MHITIFGTGGIGGYLAGKFGSLLGTHDTAVSSLSLVARGEHLAAIRTEGLTFVNPDGSEQLIRPTRAAEDFSSLTPPDLLFLCVKGYDLPGALEEIAPRITEETVVIPLLNGADIYERVRSGLESGTVLPGAIYISSAITAPGRVEHRGGEGLLILGRGRDSDDLKPEAVLKMLEDAGVPYQWHDDPFPAIWSKFLFIAPFSLATAATGKSLGEALADRQVRSDLQTMMEEVAAVARARGVELPEDAVDTTLGKAESFPPQARTSFQRDIEAGRVQDERDLFGGTVLRLGEELGVATPAVRRYMELLPGSVRNRGDDAAGAQASI